MGCQVKGYLIARHVLCHHSCIWSIENIVQRDSDEIHGQEKPHKYPLYFVHSDLDSFILYNDGDMDSQIAQLEDDVYNPEESKAIPEEDKIVTIQTD